MKTLVGTQIRFGDAVIEALRSEMHRDPGVVLMITERGRVAAELGHAFGDDRLVEVGALGSAIVLAAAGAAGEGQRPVCELVGRDGGSTALAQIVELGAMHDASGGSCPVTIRVAWGDPEGDGIAAESDPLGFLLGAPGLKIVEPATAADAKGLMVSALADDEPVCVLEHAALLDQIGTVPEGAHMVEIGRARLARAGELLTVVAHGVGVEPAERALDDAGIDADLIDLRSLQPLDTAAVLTSVRKTGRLLLVEDGACAGRVTGALIAAIWEQGFEYLDAPPSRIGADAIGGACDELLAY
ncbi:MAG: transketolase C-terminal domain-containing protein [Solirubrobacterales bacterium]